MVHYFPKMRILSFAIGCGIPIAALLVYWFGFGGMIGFTDPVGMVLLALLIFGPILSFNFFNRRASAEFDRIMNLYNEDCDPQAFVDEGALIVQNAQSPYNPFEAWFLSFYALALLDVGRAEEAAQIGKNMQDFAESAENNEEKASYLVNIIPLVLRLFGPAAGLSVIDRALEIVQNNPAPNSAEQEGYLISQKRMVEAVENHDAAYLLERCEAIRTNASGNQQMRVRVLEAEQEAQLREITGDAVGARECWQFVADNGNRLPSVEEARRHL